jgi:alpha-tubulin suppressor-like RCC1 family protein
MATCPAGLDPYTASAETLAACGDRIVPRVSLTSQSNGATESVYVTPQGRKVRFITPPPSFQSSKASPAELELYGIPAEPAKDSPEYPKWKAMIDQNIQAQAPPKHLIQASNGPVEPTELSLAAEPGSEPGFFNTGSSASWGGYVNDVPTGSNENAYTHVTGYYKEPAGSTTFECPAGASSSTWVGLGGWATGKEILGQDGTVLRWELNGKERGHHEAFYEILPKEPVYLNFFGSPGSFMEADTKWVASEGAYHFYLANFKTGKFIAPKAEGEFDGESADFIDEREFGHELFDFEKVTFQAFTNGTAFQKFPTEKIPMYNGKEENVQVSNVVNKYEFHNTFKSCKKAGTKEEKEYSQLGNGHPAPKVTTGESSEVTGSTAKVGGTVNPEGDNTVYQFEYGTEAGNFEASSPPNTAGEGSTTVPVSASLTGLRSGTTYYYRLVASSGNGVRDGEERTFKTTGSPPPPPPTVTTEGASGIGAHKATLGATVNPNGADTHYYFEYGTVSTLYENDTPALPGNDAGSGTTPVKVNVGLSGLAPYTTYYYRVVASNSTGTSYGAQREFTTTATGTLSAGTKDTCALMSSGGVDCWGENYFGEVYPESSEKKITTPVAVKGVTNAIEVAAGGSHVCALLSGGSIECWGDNQRGELGIGYTSRSSTPVRVIGITNAIAITAGDADTCALLSGGTIDCWGENVYGELGNGTTTNSSTPVPVKGITNAIAVTAGYASTCAVLSGGGMDCWGYNGYGELGNGTTKNSSTPVPVKGITNASATAVPAVGEVHACALLSGGSLDCWGYNEQGELGNGTTTNSSTPVAVSGITNAATVAAGYFHTCASLSAGGDDCWGENYFGELGNGTTTNSSTPVAASGITTATGVAAGEAHSCARLIGGGVDCWGDNIDGQLGNGTTNNSTTPVAVSGIP